MITPNYHLLRLCINLHHVARGLYYCHFFLLKVNLLKSILSRHMSFFHLLQKISFEKGCSHFIILVNHIQQKMMILKNYFISIHYIDNFKILC